MPKFMLRILPLLLIMPFAGARVANAQGLSAYFGLGSATDSANHQTLDSFGDVGPKMGGVFGTVGADFMVRPNFGLGAEYSFRGTQDDYAPQVGVKYRPVFYDFNGIWHPVASKSRVVPEIQAGVGGANLKFYENATQCAIAGVCTTLNQYIASSNHFQLHVSGGVRLYVTPSVYIRPQFDAHWVNNFQEFGRSWVPQYSVAVGYTFGQR